MTVILKSGTIGRCESGSSEGDYVTIYFFDCNGCFASEYGEIAEILEY